MYNFVLLKNTVPFYYKKFKKYDDANTFGFALKLLGIKYCENYRFKIFDKEPKFINKKRYNGYPLFEMKDEMYQKIIKEMNLVDFKRIV